MGDSELNPEQVAARLLNENGYPTMRIKFGDYMRTLPEDAVNTRAEIRRLLSQLAAYDIVDTHAWLIDHPDLAAEWLALRDGLDNSRLLPAQRIGLADRVAHVGRYNEALRLYQALLQDLYRVESPKDEDVAKTLYRIADVTYHQGKKQETATTLRELITGFGPKLGQDNPIIMDALHLQALVR